MPCAGSAVALTSGSCRAPAVSTPGTPDCDCHDGVGQFEERPPPEPPPWAPLFHTVSDAGASGWRMLLNEVPPTATTYGWDAGSSTERCGNTGEDDENSVFAQSSEPSSPEEAKTVWPWAAASSKSRFSTCAAPGAPIASACSHSPQLVVITFARSSDTI